MISLPQGSLALLNRLPCGERIGTEIKNFDHSVVEVLHNYSS